MKAFYDTEFAEHLAVAQATSQQMREPFLKIVDACVLKVSPAGVNRVG